MNSHLIYFNCFHVIFLLRNRRRMLSKLWSVFVLFVGMETFLTELIMPDLLYITRVPFDQCWRHRWSRFTKVGKTQLNHLCQHKALNPANLSLLGVQKWSMISVSPMKPPPLHKIEAEERTQQKTEIQQQPIQGKSDTLVVFLFWISLFIAVEEVCVNCWWNLSSKRKWYDQPLLRGIQ